MGTLSYSNGKRFGYTGRPGTCRWCGDKLRLEFPEDTRGGYRDNGQFCSLRCGFQWAVRKFGISYA